MASQYEWHSYCSLIWKYDKQCFWEALWLYYFTCVHNYGGTFAWVTNWTLSQVSGTCLSGLVLHDSRGKKNQFSWNYANSCKEESERKESVWSWYCDLTTEYHPHSSPPLMPLKWLTKESHSPTSEIFHLGKSNLHLILSNTTAVPLRFEICTLVMSKGLETCAGTCVRVLQVQVEVGIFRPLPNPYPQHGWQVTCTVLQWVSHLLHTPLMWLCN